MVTREDIEGFLERLAAEGDATFSEVEEGFWVVKPAGALGLDVVVNYSPPVVVLRVKVMTLQKGDPANVELYRRLLELNASELVHGSYGIEVNSVVLSEALELSHLDYSEFLAAYEGMTLALASHLRELSTFIEAR
jgi:hypothetical protein